MSEVSREERTEKVAGGKAFASGRSSLIGYADNGFSVIERWLSYLGMTFLIGLMVMVVVEVVARYVFNRPMHGYIDIMEMMMALLVFLTLAYCQHEGGHIRMELFMTRVLKEGRRYHVAEFFHLLISLIGFGIIAFYSLKEAQHAYAINDLSLTIYLPTWPAKMATAIGSIFLCLRFVMQMFQSVTQVVVGVKKTER